MKSLTSFTLVLAIMILLMACEKDKTTIEPVTAHCQGLETLIKPGDNAEILVPSAFTPNSDGLNDIFMPIILNVQSYSLKIYDSTSTLVHHSTQLSTGWAPSNITKYQKFYYGIQVTTTNGSKVGKCGEVFALKCIPGGSNPATFSFRDQFDGHAFTLPTSEVLGVCN